MKIKIENLSKSFNKVAVLENAELEINQGQVLVLIGPSGGGKSTLLRILAGLEKPERGNIAINGKELSFDEDALHQYRKTIGVVFQAYNLFPHLSALRNITLPLEEVQNYTSEEAKKKAFRLLSRFQLEDHAHKYPHQLSGGQQQRVAIARAVANSSGLLLLDEPTSALDPGFTAEVLEMIEELKAEGKDIVLVTHEMGFARKVADHIAYVDQGTILEQGASNQLFDSPKSSQLREFLNRILRY
jgi:polar amino acid transport system ATP-binding protein